MPGPGAWNLPRGVSGATPRSRAETPRRCDSTIPWTGRGGYDPRMHLARRWMVTAALALLAPSGFGQDRGKADPWRLPEPDYPLLAVTLVQTKKHSYALTLARKAPGHAAGPERVDLADTGIRKGIAELCRRSLKEGKFAEAAFAAETFLKDDPSFHDLRATLGLALYLQGKTKEAIPALRTALIGNRRNPEAWQVLGQVAEDLRKRVVRPVLRPRGWVLPLEDGDIQVGFADSDDPADFPWNYYAMARAVYRYEGLFGRAFPGREYRFTFREQIEAVGAAVQCAGDMRVDGKKVGEDLTKLLREKDAGTLVPFAFFAMYPEPVPAEPEKDFDLLRPRLEKYFDEKILVKK